MSDPRETASPRQASFANWEDRAAGDRQTREERQATEVFLAALGLTPTFANRIFLKGGVLVGAVYESGRNTADLDFSTTMAPSHDFPARLRAELTDAIPVAAAMLGMPDKTLRLQSFDFRPRKDSFVESDTPALEIRFAYADIGTRQEQQLLAGQGRHVIYADISFREPIDLIERIVIAGTDLSFFAYSKCDLIAEKLRALLQQTIRDKRRRQDVYDLHYVLTTFGVDDGERIDIAATFIAKCRARGIAPTRASFDDPDLRRRAQADWHTLAVEVESLLDFDPAFVIVRDFYRSLDLP